MKEKIYTTAKVIGIALAIMLAPSVMVYSAITQTAGLAVAQTTSKWNNLRDMAVGDGNTSGVGLFSPCLWNGLSCDRQRGSITFGALVDVTRVPTSGTAFYAIRPVNLSTSSVNYAFGFTSKKVLIIAPITNTDSICIDWLGATAACPAANTAGDATLQPGTSMILDDYSVSSLSAIAASGTQAVNIQAWN